MSTKEYSDVWVCEDCYFAHHYGEYSESEACFNPEAHDIRQAEIDEAYAQWGGEFSDNTCSDHTDPTYDEEGEELTRCECGNEDSGLDNFSWSACQVCCSHLGESRSRLAWWSK